MLNVTLFTKADCGLCDEVKSELGRLASSYPHRLTEKDITQDPKLFERFRSVIPVLHIAGRELQAPISLAELETALGSALFQED